MGHDIAVNHRTYHRWLDQADIAAVAASLNEVFVADGDAPPERFDHAYTLLCEQVPRYTHTNFLRKNELGPSRNRGQITALVRHRSTWLPGPSSSSAES